MQLLIKSARVSGKEKAQDISVDNGRITEVADKVTGKADLEIEAGGKIVLPAFIDMHIHLDTALTVGKPRFNESGTLLEGMRIWGDYKRNLLNKEEMKERARKVVESLVIHGITRIRTHADATEPTLTTVRGLLELKKEVSDIADLEVTAFPQDGIFTERTNAELLEKAMEMGADNVGLIPHNEFTREDGVKSVGYAFELAKKYGKKVDGHIDETDDDQSRFIEVLAAETIKNGYQGKVTAGHATAMHSYNNSYAYKLFGLLKKADVTVVANPTVNLHLQGRFDTYPKRRGLTRIKELLEYGVNVALGNDDIMDPWYPLGRGDILQALYLGVHAAHLMGRKELVRSLDLVTYNSARALGIEEKYGVTAGKMADLVVLDAHDELEVIRNQPNRLHVIKSGRVIASSAESEHWIHGEAGKKNKAELH
jgi:cytosine deaminase